MQDDKDLWNKILNFNLDNPIGEYSFSIRLASENNWTKEFTEKAILEYKKFMYLVAINDEMLSPSEIIDIVWHQHLVFTESYNSFCKILNKQVKHIPSTHNKNEIEKFKKSKERTRNLYLKQFGKQSDSIWNYSDMYGVLKLDKSKLKLKTFIIFSILSFILISIPFSIIIRPIYSRIDNPYFVISFIFLSIITFTILEIFNKRELNKIFNEFSLDSFVYNLSPYELIYMRTQNLSNVLNGIINELINKGNIAINNLDKTLELSNNKSDYIEHNYILLELENSKKITYSSLLKILSIKPIFLNIKNSIVFFRKYFIKSQKFSRLFYINFLTLYILLMFSFTRVLTGIYRNKPIIQISFINIIFIIISIFFLYRLSKIMFTKIIPNFYESKIINRTHISRNWQWEYFISGNRVLLPIFLTLIVDFERSSFSSSSSSSCGSGDSSGGSSCGSSCGGCGGGGD